MTAVRVRSQNDTCPSDDGGWLSRRDEPRVSTPPFTGGRGVALLEVRRVVGNWVYVQGPAARPGLVPVLSRSQVDKAPHNAGRRWTLALRRGSGPQGRDGSVCAGHRHFPPTEYDPFCEVPTDRSRVS